MSRINIYGRKRLHKDGTNVASVSPAQNPGKCKFTNAFLLHGTLVEFKYNSYMDAIASVALQCVFITPISPFLL